MGKKVPHIRKKDKHSYKNDYSKRNESDKRANFLNMLSFVIVIVAGCAAVFLYWNQMRLRQRVTTPLDTVKMVNENDTLPIADPDRFWGSYRSNVYFGLKTRSKQSPVFGLMWMAQFTGQQPEIRHWCDQNDKMPMYGWFVHDAKNFGVQEILDNYYSISTDFVKRKGGENGGDWSARVAVKPRQGAEEAVVSLFFYVCLDGAGSLKPNIKDSRLVSIQGYSEELGNYVVKFSSKPNESTKFNYLVTNSDGLHQLKEKLIRHMALFPWDNKKKFSYIGLNGMDLHKGQKAEYIVYQVTTTLPYGIEILFESGSITQRENELRGQAFQNELQAHVGEFSEKFEEVFNLKQKGFNDDQINFAKAVLSNMLGGIGYFHGTSLVRSKYTDKEPVEYWNASLYTAVPSRSFFPRGFLWDEGFHNLLIQKWDMSISMDIIAHWLDLLNIDGWIPREQILGLEARARVPDEFIVQHNENANPPTLFLPLQNIVKKLIQSEDPKHHYYLETLFPRLQVWYDWFNTTQNGPVRSTYRWRGRDFMSVREINPKTLTSGLDDYPRASHPTENERHLDLRCWMALMSKVMADIAQSINKPWQEYDATYQMLTDIKLLDELHWSDEKQRYSDYGLHTDNVKLERPKPKQTPGQRPPPAEKQRVELQKPEYRYVDSQFGYVNIFPFLIKIVEPNSPKLGKILQDIQDPSLIWSKFGLRSLGKTSPLYNKYNTEHDPPYWRGAIWLNINYLALGALHHYSNIDGPYKSQAEDIYKQLRNNIINNMYAQYRATGYIWENYCDKTGKGKGSHPFTGWSALVVAIMAEEY